MPACKYMAATLQYFKFAATRNDFMIFTKHAKVISATKGKVQVELEVLPEMASDSGDLSAGCIFTIFDNVSTSAIFAKYHGVPATVAAQVHYFSPVSVGDKLRIDAEILHRIGDQVYVEAQFHSIEGNRVVAKGGQTMAYPGGKAQEVKDLPTPEKKN